MGNKLKHTPGPWEENKNVIRSTTIKNDRGFNIAIARIMNDPGLDEYMANARLIVAAPEMLEKLKICYTQFLNVNGYLWLINDLKNTIEKATGLTIDEVLNERD